MKKLASLLLLALPLALGCSSSDGGSTGTGGTGGTAGTGGAGGSVFSADPPLVLDEDERPAMVAIPSDYDPSTSYPLLILFHGIGFTGMIQAGFFQIFDIIDERQLVFVYPDGIDGAWNGAGCCGDSGDVDDVGYITGLIEEAKQVYNIDEDRVYLMGHSNGSWMSFRMACERSELIAAIVTLAGATWNDPDDCQPATLPVSVLNVHGTADMSVPYEGGDFQPGAVETVERFAGRAGCDLEATTSLESIDLFPTLAGVETHRVSYSTGCAEGIDAELWTIEEGPHTPVFLETEWASL
ncbi:MAG: hypothetical protein O7F08_10510, partial [Deltaproteobacteria bacterium]|nr:hypothetical protein [Deltaproteobacteria bacterium]